MNLKKSVSFIDLVSKALFGLLILSCINNLYYKKSQCLVSLGLLTVPNVDKEHVKKNVFLFCTSAVCAIILRAVFERWKGSVLVSLFGLS